MNIYFILAGVIGLIGALMHIFMGFGGLHKWLEKHGNTQMEDHMHGLLSFFWHFGSMLVLSLSALLLLEGLNLIPIHAHLQWFICVIWLIMTLFYILLLRPYRQEQGVMLPAYAGVISSVLILIGIF
ncbi:hypothetical protein [Ferrimonas gelatinilytica]|uniref:DUF423 domain-containing protein n=1 Tax=Ferrimonas gelatinilytica TaxID=1255257 RepID=A0ABP9S202_9GAMM